MTIEKAHNTQGRAIAAGNDATEAARRAETAHHTTAARYSVHTVANRIKIVGGRHPTHSTRHHRQARMDHQRRWAKCVERRTNRRIRHDRLTVRLEEQQDQLTYWLQVRADQIAGGAATNYSRETINKGDFVRHRFGWAEVVRINAKSVSVRTEYSWTNTLEYEAIKEVKTAAEMSSQAAS